MSIFVTSDTHFDHENIIEYCSRPFNSVYDMNHAIIKNWNQTVSKDDFVYHLGDFAFANKRRAEDLLSQLNGIKILIRGNHDKKDIISARGLMTRFDYKKLRYENNTFIMSHYPMMCWEKMGRGSIMLHGHCHGTLRDDMLKLLNGRLFEVGMDKWNFTPVPILHFVQLASQFPV